MKKWIIGIVVLVLVGAVTFGLTLNSRKISHDKAIGKVLRDDEFIYKAVHKGRPLKELLESLNDDDRLSYVRNMKHIPLQGCPSKFKTVYAEHVVAWESNDQKRIRATWIDVISVARIYGVSWENRY